METTFGEKLPDLCGPVVSDLKAMGKRSMEWDLNDWRWDGDLFVATPQNPLPSDCRSKQFVPIGSDIPGKPGASNGFSSGLNVSNLGDEREKRDLEKRRRYIEVTEQLNRETDSLDLKLGEQMFPVMEREADKLEDKTWKKSKVLAAPSGRAVCQVEDCKADLSNSKDYHRRHKVCEVHSKATRALVGSVLQRFCQQCSRFHVLQEFDEGKRSCRRRLAGHNKRRRKTHPENAVNAVALNSDQGNNYLLISLLRILSNIHASNSDQTKDQDLLSHLLRNLASLAGSSNDMNPTGLLPLPQDLQKMGASLGPAVKDSDGPAGPAVHIASSSLTQNIAATDNNQGGFAQNASASRQSGLFYPGKSSSSVKENDSDTIAGRAKLKNIDLNNVYDGSQDFMDDQLDNVPESHGNGSIVVPSWLCKDSQRSSPPQNSGNSGSTPSQSPSTSSGEAQSRTDRIVFKLFGKDPSDFPLVLRKQILDWLSSSPIDMESYIRPGCIVLTIYACMDGSTWEELYDNLNSSFRRLLDPSSDSFWRTGWIYARVQHHATFAYNGQIVIDTPSPLNIHGGPRISSITPLAVSFSEAAHFVVKGFNLSHSTSRLLCALEGKYLVHESCADIAGADLSIAHGEIECLSFSCVVPDVVGRGFIEVEDHGLGSSFFPFIVAEKDVCSEICNLESIIEASEVAEEDGNVIKARKQALDFVHEIGWLFHRSRLVFRLREINGDVDLFPFERVRWLVEFAIDREWSAVVKKLLNIVLDGTVEAGQYTSTVFALQEIGLLHRAVRKNSRTMVEFLLAYHPSGSLVKTVPEQKQLDEAYLFRPDTMGPGGLTPLHLAASLDSCEDVVDALTEDPESVGIGAWKNTRDSTGLTPHDYACLRGHYSYVHLVQRKMNKEQERSSGSGNGQVIVDIPRAKQKMGNASKPALLEMEKVCGQRQQQRMKTMMTHCRQCEEKLAFVKPRACVTIYRPAMLSMVAIAAVCVCAALLFKSSPEVLYSCRPFRWELLKYGSE